MLGFNIYAVLTQPCMMPLYTETVLKIDLILIINGNLIIQFALKRCSSPDQTADFSVK